MIPPTEFTPRYRWTLRCWLGFHAWMILPTNYDRWFWNCPRCGRVTPVCTMQVPAYGPTGSDLRLRPGERKVSTPPQEQP